MPHLSIRALGPLNITLDGQPVTTLAYDKVWALLLNLALSVDHAQRRERLAALLWPDQPEPQALTNLRQALTRLRKVLGDSTAAPSFLLTDRSTIQFNAASDYTVDVAEFSTLLATCARHSHRHTNSCAACAERRERAVALYRGDFLNNFYISDSDLFDEWAALVREPLHQHALDALAALVAYHEWHGNYAQAQEYCERQLELDPWREEAYRQMMRILAHSGQRSAALHWYERCRAMLEVELGVTPAPETITLYEQIRAAALDVPLQAEYQAPPSPTKRHHNLPLQPTPFLGRRQELAALADLVANPQCRLITLLGLGGSGKTRLALQAAASESEAFADGTVYVTLAPLNAAEFIGPTVAAALDFTLANHTSATTELLHYLRQKELLLVFDNFEHLLAPPPGDQNGNGNGSATELLAGILQQAPSVKIFVTSRERLNIQGEWVFDVGGLETPAASYHDNEDFDGEERTTEFEAYSAVALFLQTARRVQKEFSPTAVDRAAIVRICQLVQGMPLAIELAAAWVRVLSCREIAHEIALSLDFLAVSLRDVPERHRSLQAVFDHSWKLLSIEEQRVFAFCSVFRGGFTREAAAEVAGASLILLAALVDKSLLRRNPDGRYEVHELAQQYAAAKLMDSQQEVQARNRHLNFFMHFAERAEPQIRSGEHVAQWHEWVESDHDNLRAALEWSLAGGEFEPGLRIVGALWEFWMNRGYGPEGQAQAERFLARPEAAARTVLRAKAGHTAGVCAFYHSRLATALAWFAETAAIGGELGVNGKYVLALGLIGQGYTRLTLQEFDAVPALSQKVIVLGEELQDAWVAGDGLNQLGMLAWRLGDAARAHHYLCKSLESFHADGYSVMRAPVLRRLGIVSYRLGDYAAAEAYLWESLKICEELGDKIRGSSALTQLGYLAMAQGNNQAAEELLAKALMLICETGHLLNRINPFNALGRLAQRQGDYERACAMHHESLALCIEVKHHARLVHTLEEFACLAARQTQAEVAVRLFGATDIHLASSDIHQTSLQVPFDPIWRQEHDHLLALARAQLGEASFEAIWAEGAAMTLDEAVALAGAQ